MSQERRKIIEMLAEGKLTPDDAERLLDKLGQTSERDDAAATGDMTEKPRPGKPKYLRIVVNSTNNDRVNIRVPLALVRTGLKLSTMLPPHASEKLSEKGIDLSQLSELKGDELLEALRELTVDVASGDGDTVRVYCE